jgi:hypothetical protein
MELSESSQWADDYENWLFEEGGVWLLNYLTSKVAKISINRSSQPIISHSSTLGLNSQRLHFKFEPVPCPDPIEDSSIA